MNKYWEIGERNKFGKECYKLHLDYDNYYEDILLSFVQDEKDENVFIYSSKEMNVEYDTIIANDIEDAKQQFEDMLMDYWYEKINDLENRILDFKEAKNESN